MPGSTVDPPAGADAAAQSRVLLLAPTRRDAEAIEKVLRGAGIQGRACPTVAQMCREIANGAGAVLVAEEHLTADPEPLIACIAAQPVWSDLSTLILSRAGAELPKLTSVLPRLGNVSVIERPVRITTLLSLVRMTLRARERQYQVKAQMAERERSAAELRTSEQRLRLAVQTGKLGVWELDLPSMDLACSDGCKAHFGRNAAGPFTYGEFLDSIHPDDRDRVRSAVDATVRTGADYDIEFRTIWPDGTTHWLFVRGKLADGDGRTTPGRLAGMTMDVTDRREAEDRRAALLEAERAARAEAERAGRMKDEFLSTLSHELRTPLNAILGWSQVLVGATPTDPDLAEGLESIERNARAQTQIIEDLLDMSRIVSGKVRLNYERVDLTDAIRGGVDTVRHAAAAKGVRVQTTIEPPDAVVGGDGGRLRQVFWNLLSNAVKFTPPGGLVSVRLTRAGSTFEVAVTDTGEGINPAFLPHVFDRFRQADGSTTRRHGGLGLGLAIVKQLVELHGGEVAAHSDGHGRGSTFAVTLPITPPQPTPPAGFDVATGPISIEPKPLAADIRGIRILIVDDEPDARDLLRRVLEDRRATVAVATSAADALRQITSDSPDVLVSDIGMPGDDGYWLIDRVRALPPDRGGRTPAIALTAYARPEDRDRSTRAGFQKHLLKPTNPQQLVAAIAELHRPTGS